MNALREINLKRSESMNEVESTELICASVLLTGIKKKKMVTLSKAMFFIGKERHINGQCFVWQIKKKSTADMFHSDT